ncbi:MAG: c-type cytochrome [Myxococcales bacterium]|nr:c-type cytochrome [Myxococcales bacterium]
MPNSSKCRWSCLPLLLSLGCNTFDSPSTGDEGFTTSPTTRPTTSPTQTGGAVTVGGAPAPTVTMAPFPTGSVRGLDDSPVLRADKAPPPIEGGTLLASADGLMAVAADPDRDRVSIVSLADAAVLHEVQLLDGDVPGRLVEDAAGRVHVVLRYAGAVASIELSTGELLARTEVCGSPRGIDYRAATDALLVACAGGELVALDPAGGGVRTRTMVEQDLQDVVVTSDDRLFVSTFKRAELVELGSAGEVLGRRVPSDLQGPFAPAFFPPPEDGPKGQHLQAAVAWAALRGPDNSVVMVHQNAQTDEIAIETSESAAPVEGGYGGGASTCSSIVNNGVSVMGADGGVRSMGPVASLVLPVDGAVSPDGRWLAVGAAGSAETIVGMDLALVLFGLENPPDVAVLDLQADAPPDVCQIPGLQGSGAILDAGQSIGVAFDAQGRLLVQTREPNLIRVYGAFQACALAACAPDFDIDLGGAPMRDTGHDLFHVDAGGGIACASCHPGGGDDGRTWLFSGLGPRRTQLFNMGIKGTEPLHWDGDMATFDELVGEVFVRRMGGAPQSPERITAMADWIESLEPHPPLRAAEDAAALRGKQLFESEEVGCASCHNGALLTNNESFDVGTGGVFQVPSLVNVGYHQPFIHTGCAETLRERFDPDCGGGDLHGRTSQLSEEAIDDLVAYLESL